MRNPLTCSSSDPNCVYRNAAVISSDSNLRLPMNNIQKFSQDSLYLTVILIPAENSLYGFISIESTSPLSIASVN